MPIIIIIILIYCRYSLTILAITRREYFKSDNRLDTYVFTYYRVRFDKNLHYTIAKKKRMEYVIWEGYVCV